MSPVLKGLSLPEQVPARKIIGGGLSSLNIGRVHRARTAERLGAAPTSPLIVRLNARSAICITRFLWSRMKNRQSCEQNERSQGGPALIAMGVHLLIIAKWSKMVPCFPSH